MLNFRLRDAYPSAPGYGSAQGTGGGSPASQQQTIATQAAGVPAGRGPVTGAPLTLTSGLTTWAVFAAVVVGFMLIGQRVGNADDFKNIRLTVYNALSVGLLAIIGILFWKFVAATVKVPIASDLIVSV